MSRFGKDLVTAGHVVQAERPRAIVVALLLAVASLVALNILTLTNERIHQRVFGLLNSGLSALVPASVAADIFSQSPTVLAAKRMEVAERVGNHVSFRAVANAGKNLSALGPQLTPILGAAAVLALTASDLYDDCQTLKDINDLRVAFGIRKEDEATVCGLKVPFR